MNKPTQTTVRDASVRSECPRIWAALGGRSPAARQCTVSSDPVEHDAQIVCGHLGDCRNRESNGLRDRCDRFEVSQTPGRVVIAKASVERLVARGRCNSFAFEWTIKIERRRRWKDRGRTPDQSERRVPREMWTMLMQMIPSAEAIGQGDCETSRTIGARTLVTRVAFTHAATLCKASGSRSEGWKTKLGKFLAK